MRRRRTVLACILLTAALAGCGGGDKAAPDPLNDDSDRPLDVRVTAMQTFGAVEAERLDFAAADGERVPALFARPSSGRQTGCLIAEGGFRSGKRAGARLWQPAARLGLSTFSLDMRLHGERAKGPQQLDEAERDPAAMEDIVTGTVVDLRRAIDYLTSLPECRGRIAYAGFSFGGIMGSILTGRDPRVGAAVIMSVPPTFASIVDEVPYMRDHPEQREAVRRRLSRYDPVKWIPRIAPRPVMLLNGNADPIVPIKEGRDTQAAAREPAVKIIYAGGHNPGAPPAGKKNGASIARFLGAWLRRDAGDLSG